MRYLPTVLRVLLRKPTNEAARKAGANYYLVKPVDESTLLEHVALLTGRKP